MRVLSGALLLVAAIGACGCGERRDRLDGTHWQAPLIGVPCYAEAGFEHGTYAWALVCTLDGGSPAATLEVGDYSITGDELTLVPRQASCPSDVVGHTLAFSVSRDLFITENAPGQILTFVSLPAGPVPHAGIPVGCFDAQGSFVPNPLTPL